MSIKTLRQEIANLKEWQDPWDTLGVETPDCPMHDPFCTTCEVGNWELQQALEPQGTDPVSDDPATHTWPADRRSTD